MATGSRDPVEALIALASSQSHHDYFTTGMDKKLDALATALRDVLKAAAPFEEYEHCCEQPCPHLECRDIRALFTAFEALRKVVRDG